jgi:hypothetical protein
MRLIDADELIKRCMNGIDNEFIAIVNEQPTVCDIDAIKQEIEEQRKRRSNRSPLIDGTYLDCLQIIDRHMKGDSK